MEDSNTMKTLELIEELEELVDDSSTVPITGKVIIDPEDIYAIIRDLRLSLPDDMKQAKWIREQKQSILDNAKAEYERIIKEANKEASYLTDNHEITMAARKMASDTLQETEMNCRLLKLKTYDYVDRILYDMQGKMDELNMKYFGEMFTNLEHTFQDVADTLSGNREEIKALAYRTQNEGLESED